MISTIIWIQSKDIGDEMHFSLKHIKLDHLVRVESLRFYHKSVTIFPFPFPYRIRSLSLAYTQKSVFLQEELSYNLGIFLLKPQ